MPRLGKKYPVNIEVVSKPKAQYQTDEYFELELPVAPAVMIDDEIVVEGNNISEYELECRICSRLELPQPDQPQKPLLKRIFKPGSN
jgi:hypothetical protein